MLVTKDILYVGVKDYATDLFEGQYKIPNGITYNSYIINDEKIAVMDTVDVKFTEIWLQNIANTLGEKTPDYLIVQHMEPDHSASIKSFIEKYPDAVIVTNAKAADMITNYYGSFEDKITTVVNEEKLILGKHILTFIFAPMVHWPEVMVSYDQTDKVVFSADAFGKFGADETEFWDDEARRYYIGIVGKYGAQVQALLKKLTFPIEAICPLHGPVLKENIGHNVELYNTWSSYEPEEDGVLIAYTSVYGHTKEAAVILEDKLSKADVKTAIYDLARNDWSAVVAEAFRYSKLVLATTTYNNDIFPFMKQFIDHLTERNFQNRKIGIIENGSWAPTAGKIMTEKLSGCKNLVFCENKVTIKSALNETSLENLNLLADEIKK